MLYAVYLSGTYVHIYIALHDTKAIVYINNAYYGNFIYNNIKYLSTHNNVIK